MSKIKENIEKMAGDGSQIDPTEFENLILDDVNIEKFSPEDKTYMEEFVAVDMLGMNATKLNSLVNFPNMPKVYRLELNENNIKGEELVHLKHLKGLSVLKLANNKITEFAQLECLKEIPNLINLDLEGNEISKSEGYKDKVFEMLPTLSILDGKNKAGDDIISQESDEDEEEYGGEDGEEDDEDFDQQDYIDKISKQLTEEQKKDLEAQGISVK